VRVAIADLAKFGRAVRPRLRQKLGGHADEHETSLVLAIEPDAVRMERAEADYGHAPDAPATVFYQPVIFDIDPGSGLDWSRIGARGDPSLATRETGEVALREITRELVEGLVTVYPDLQ
jgi:creatinine amidohydrolase